MASSPIPFMGSAAPGVAGVAGVNNPLTTNPTGAQGGNTAAGGVPVTSSGGQTGSAAPTSLTPNMNLGNLLGTATQGGSAPGTATGQNGQVVNGGQTTQRQDDRTLGELQSYYGEGMGSWIYSMMQTGGMNTNLVNQVDQSEIAAMQPQINQGSVALNSILGAQGVGGQSSTGALANSNYMSQAVTQENAQVAKTYLGEYDQGQQLLQSILGGVLNTNQQGTANANNPMDILSGILGIGQSGSNLFSTLSGLIPGLG